MNQNKNEKSAVMIQKTNNDSINISIRNTLALENQTLKIQLSNMTGNKEQLEQLLKERDKTIDGLKKGNE